MLDNLLNELRYTTDASEQSEIDGRKILSHQKVTKSDINKLNPNDIVEVGFTGRKKGDYEALQKTYNKSGRR